jgi:hypothetical protein
MGGTYTSNEISVSDGDIVSHDTDTVNDNLEVTAARARWKGVNGTKTVYDRNSNFKQQTAAANETGGTNYEGYINWTLDYPTVPSGYTFDRHEVMVWVDAEYEGPEFDDLYWWEQYDSTEDDNSTADIDVHDVVISHGFDEPDPEVFIAYEDDIDGFTITESYGYIDDTTLSYLTTNYTADDPGRAWLYWYVADDDNWSEDTKFTLTTEIETVGWKDVITYTTDPFATRDVDASYTGQLNDGEWSPWVSMSGFTAGTNEMYQNIDGSGKAVFQFEYDWEQNYPEPQKEMRFYDEDNDRVHKVSLVDPSNSNLHYNHHRYALNGTVYALDVVDPSDGGGIDWVKWYHPTHGEYSPRAYDTIQL